MVKQTNKKKHYKSYKFKTTMKRNKKHKRTHRKQLGGVINFPIYENVSREADVCPKLTALNEKVGHLIDSYKKIPAAGNAGASASASANNNKTLSKKEPPPLDYLKFGKLKTQLIKIESDIERKKFIDSELKGIDKQYIESLQSDLQTGAISDQRRTEIDNELAQIKNLKKEHDRILARIGKDNNNIEINQQTIKTELNTLENSVGYKTHIEFLKQKAEADGIASASSATTIDMSIEDIKSSLTLFDFQNIINTNCDDNFYILIDINENHVFANYNNLLDDSTKVHVFKITPEYQIKYLGRKEKTQYPLYTFDSLYEEGDNYQTTKPEYWFMTLKYLQNSEVLKVFFDIKSETDGTLDEYEKLREQFLNKLPTGGIIVRDTNNIIKNITFLNKMEEFIRLINIDFELFNSKNYYKFLGYFTIKNNTNNTNNLTKSQLEKYTKFIDYIFLSKKKLTTDKTQFRDKKNFVIKTLNEINTDNLFKFKSFLIEENLHTDIDFLLFLYDKLYYKKIIKNLKNPYADFLYTCILLNKSGFINTIEKIDEIKKAYIYISLSEAIKRPINELTELKIAQSPDIQKKIDEVKKQYTKYILKLENEQLLIFFDEMNILIKQLHDVNNEFVINKILNYEGIIKNLILICYVYYLNKSYDTTRPISVKSHIDKYLYGAIKNIKLEKIQASISFKILQHTTVNFETNNSVHVSFSNCGETTILNFFKYLLFDKEKGFITNDNIIRLNDRYPGNLLKDLFDGLKELRTDADQFEYLSTKVNDFAKIIITYSNNTSNNIMFFQVGKYNINPTFDNLKKMILFLLSGEKKPLVEDAFISELLSIFNKKFEKITNEIIIIDNLIKFYFDLNHAYANLILSTMNNNIVHDPLLKNIIQELYIDHYYPGLYGYYPNLKKITFGDRFNLILDGLDIPKIEELNFGMLFNNELNGDYPNLKKLSFGMHFNTSLDKLKMPKIKEITFGSAFNQPFSGKYPNLKKLKFGHVFNQSLDGLKIPKIKKIIIPQYSPDNPIFINTIYKKFIINNDQPNNNEPNNNEPNNNDQPNNNESNNNESNNNESNNNQPHNNSNNNESNNNEPHNNSNNNQLHNNNNNNQSYQPYNAPNNNQSYQPYNAPNNNQPHNNRQAVTNNNQPNHVYSNEEIRDFEEQEQARQKQHNIQLYEERLKQHNIQLDDYEYPVNPEQNFPNTNNHGTNNNNHGTNNNNHGTNNNNHGTNNNNHGTNNNNHGTNNNGEIVYPFWYPATEANQLNNNAPNNNPNNNHNNNYKPPKSYKQPKSYQSYQPRQAQQN
jgi:hypothetical protein